MVAIPCVGWLLLAADNGRASRTVVGCCVPELCAALVLDLNSRQHYCLFCLRWLGGACCAQWVGVTHCSQLLCSWILCGTRFELELQLALLFVLACVGWYLLLLPSCFLLLSLAFSCFLLVHRDFSCAFRSIATQVGASLFAMFCLFETHFKNDFEKTWKKLRKSKFLASPNPTKIIRKWLQKRSPKKHRFFRRFLP